MDEHRRNERKKLIAFTPVYDAHQKTLLGYLGDLSMHGAMLIGERLVEADQQITLVIDFPETPLFPAKRVQIPARVAWCRHEKNPYYYNTGVEFLEMDEENKEVIEAILERYQFHRETPA
jgi:hypothetical protein